MDMEFAAHMAEHFTFAAAPSTSIHQPFAQPSTSTLVPIFSTLAAMYHTLIPPQLETKFDIATLLLECISCQLTELQASQQEGFQELSFWHDTHDINTLNAGKEAVGDFTYHTRKLMNEVSRCFARGGLHLPSIEAKTKYEDGLYKEVREAEDAVATFA